MILALRRHFLGLLAAGTLAVVGLSLAPEPAQAAQPVRIGLLAFTSHSPTMIADAKGYFADQQLQAEFVVFQAAQPMAVAIASGDIDFGVTAISGGLISLAHKGAIKVIGGALQETPEIEGQKVLVSKAAFERGMTSPDKLKGARFGVTTAGSSFHYMAHKLADKSGYARSDLSIVPLQKVPAVIAALKTGQVDAWTIVPNIAAGLTKDGSVVDIGKVADYVDNYQVTTVFTSAAIADKKPDLVKRFLLAYSKGVDVYNAAFVDKTMPEADANVIVGIVHKYVYADQPIDKAAPRIRAGAMRINAGARMNMTSIADQLDWFKSEKLVPADVTLDMLVDKRFVQSY